MRAVRVSSSAPLGRGPSVVGVVLGGLFAVIFLPLAVGFVALPAWRAVAARGWVETGCTIVDRFEDARVSQVRGSSRVIRTARARYRFVVGDQPVEGTWGDFTPGHAVPPDLRVGMRVPCWYDPGTPTRVVLARRGWDGGAAEWMLVVTAWLASLLLGLALDPPLPRRPLDPPAAPTRWTVVATLPSLLAVTLAGGLAATATTAGASSGEFVTLVVLLVGALAVLGAQLARWWRRLRQADARRARSERVDSRP